MRKKISEPQVTERTDDIVFVQLRLPPALADALRAEGAPHRRKLPAQIIHRLQQSSDRGGADALIFGWVDPGRNKALGEALGFLTARLEVAGPMTEDRVRDRAGVLAMLKLAIGDVLDCLGADESTLSADEKNYAALEGRKFTNELLRPKAGLGSIGPRPDIEILAKVAAAEPMARSRKADR